ncbi:Enoyl-CoA hydratase [Lutibaculum baratangense AMV1]|uniref:Enoyl-CoA hydratase n=1 Tax=Lutibaculum baratangense AMV1 TaxID=631454 RepID=V4R472_9HYPH|nr:Enoyl-CoA hydratase [Lutibaculum baratangense AMV1]
METTRNGDVMIVRLARPEKKNALTSEMYAGLADALDAAETDQSVRVVMLLGSGGAFTAGNDLSDFLSNPPRGGEAPVFRFLRALARASVPLVAAVDGDAVGVGTTMLLHCDMVVASTRSRFRLPFVELGLVPEAGSTLLLPRLVGHAKAAELMMLGHFFDADEAWRLGLVNHVTEPDDLEPTLARLAASLAAKPPQALRATKRLLRGDPAAIEAAILAEAQVFAERLLSPEAREAFTAFLEKRPPDFSKGA